MKISVNGKSVFLNTPEAAWFRGIAADPKFQTVIQTAWLEYTLNHPRSTGPNDSCDLHNQQFGAKQFLDKLLNIAETDAPTPRPRDPSALISPLKEPKRSES